ncbi:MAG: hypothetical protein D3904_01045 [Candidatus Electrothrix sp. EH2]|nr:hypothetical protein [Candidatus Electrothrix sp. EH2]
MPDEISPAFWTAQNGAISGAIGWKGVNEDLFDQGLVVAGTTMVGVPFAWAIKRKVVFRVVCAIHVVPVSCSVSFMPFSLPCYALFIVADKGQHGGGKDLA